MAHDDGASLILALIVVTVFSVTVGVLLTFSDSSVRNTVALRDQNADAAGADGAAELAINALRRGTFNGTAGQCFQVGPSTSDTLPLSGFYQPTLGPAGSAAVKCELDGTRTADSPITINDANRPDNAILTLGTTAGEDGVRVNVADGRAVKVHGTVFSNSTIAVPAGGLSVDGPVVARGACTGTVQATPPPATCAIGSTVDPRGNDPNYPPPPAPTANRAVPQCVDDNVVVTFTPGRYTDSTSLNNMQRCHNAIFYFPPGTYYFDLPATDPWVIDQGYLVGGTLTAPLVGGVPPTIPGSCRSPVPPRLGGAWTPPGPNAGVQFVLGGGSRIELRRAQGELCGSYSLTSPPIVLYGLKAPVGSDTLLVPAQSGCTVAGPYPTSGCATLKATATPNSRLYLQGTAYLPQAAVDLALNNPVGSVFSVGVVARTLHVTPTATSVLTDPVIDLPDDAEAGRRILVYLTVFLCPGTSTCTTSTGTQRLRAKVGILDPSGVPVPGARLITVYSWSVLR